SGRPGDDGAAVPPGCDVVRELSGGEGDDSRVVVLRVVDERATVLDLILEFVTDIVDKPVLGVKSGMIRGEIHFHPQSVASRGDAFSGFLEAAPACGAVATDAGPASANGLTSVSEV